MDQVDVRSAPEGVGYDGPAVSGAVEGDHLALLPWMAGLAACQPLRCRHVFHVFGQTPCLPVDWREPL